MPVCALKNGGRLPAVFCFLLLSWSTAVAEEVVFAVRQPKGPHWYENFGHQITDVNKTCYGARGRLCKLDLDTGRLAVLLDDPDGGVRDPQVHYDGQRILFSYRKGGSPYYHLYEIHADGSGLRQLTDGPFDDIEPSYLPDGGIVFCSSRCQRWVPCWYVPVATIHRCDGDGSNLRPLSSNIEQDNTPWVLPDGRILYTRWEYVDRSREHFHHLWAMNPDGTGQMAYYGNLHPGDVFLDAKPIPGSARVVMVNSPNHGRQEHEGRIALVSADLGPDAREAQQIINPGLNFRDPYPVSADSFLVAQENRLLSMNAQGETRELYRLAGELARGGAWLHEPRLLRPRPREPVIPPRVKLGESMGQIIVTDIYQGRNMDGIQRGAIKSLLILENLPKPVNYTGSMDPITYGGSYTLNRVLGTVPVEEDGSVNARVPPLRSLQLVALDENDLSVKRMLSFLTVMPGEVATCTGCHEQRTAAPPSFQTLTPALSHPMGEGESAAAPLLARAVSSIPRRPPFPLSHRMGEGRGEGPVVKAAQRPPSEITPLPGAPEVFDYPRDIQPIWDQHCLGCHDADKYSGRALLTGDQGPMFTHSYFTLSARLQIADGRDLARGSYAPYTIGSAASDLVDKVSGSHHDVKLSAPELRMVKLWIDASATFPGTYAALGSGMIGPYAALQYGTRPKIDYLSWPGLKAAQQAMDRRCASCHVGRLKLPGSPADDLDFKLHHLEYAGGRPRFWEPPWLKARKDGALRPGSVEWMKEFADPRLQFSRHILYNLSRPEKSLLLLAPLAKSAGGYGLCGDIFTRTDDPDFRRMLAGIQEAKAHLDSMTRFNMAGFRPEPEYVREMKRCGILSPTWQAGDPIDVYETDRQYWQSLWHQPMR
ncbi:MAG: PD40 domain-containing protein [Verrucomicrobia bacterium]|nr:PD40 domain-containing protein [Verrucomicrobiota bacterium]